MITILDCDVINFGINFIILIKPFFYKTKKARQKFKYLENENNFQGEIKSIFHPIFFFFSIWVFFHEHSRFARQQGKGEGIYLTPLYHFHPLHGHLDISRAIAAESSPLHIAGSRTRTGNYISSSPFAKFNHSGWNLQGTRTNVETLKT